MNAGHCTHLGEADNSVAASLLACSAHSPRDSNSSHNAEGWGAESPRTHSTQPPSTSAVSPRNRPKRPSCRPGLPVGAQAEGQARELYPAQLTDCCTRRRAKPGSTTWRHSRALQLGQEELSNKNSTDCKSDDATAKVRQQAMKPK